MSNEPTWRSTWPDSSGNPTGRHWSTGLCSRLVAQPRTSTGDRLRGACLACSARYTPAQRRSGRGRAPSDKELHHGRGARAQHRQPNRQGFTWLSLVLHGGWPLALRWVFVPKLRGRTGAAAFRCVQLSRNTQRRVLARDWGGPGAVRSGRHSGCSRQVGRADVHTDAARWCERFVRSPRGHFRRRRRHYLGGHGRTGCFACCRTVALHWSRSKSGCHPGSWSESYETSSRTTARYGWGQAAGCIVGGRTPLTRGIQPRRGCRQTTSRTSSRIDADSYGRGHVSPASSASTPTPRTDRRRLIRPVQGWRQHRLGLPAI